MTNVNVHIQYRLLTLTNLFASVLWRLSTFLWFHPMARTVSISPLPGKTKQKDANLNQFYNLVLCQSI